MNEKINVKVEILTKGIDEIQSMRSNIVAKSSIDFKNLVAGFFWQKALDQKPRKVSLNSCQQMKMEQTLQHGFKISWCIDW